MIHELCEAFVFTLRVNDEREPPCLPKKLGTWTFFLGGHNPKNLSFQSEEAYVCIYSTRTCDTILFTPEGGVDIGDVDAKAQKLDVQVGDETNLQEDQVIQTLLSGVQDTQTQK